MTINYSLADKLIMQVDAALRSTFTKPAAKRAIPKAKESTDDLLSQDEIKQSISLMRINHTGEVCAQALYQGQALTARSENIKLKMVEASDEEVDHLNWCHTRLDQLGGRPSYANPFWYMSSFAMGAFAGAVGDKWSLGFLEETENQVEAHLAEHLDKLPSNDLASRSIVEQMKIDEAKHAQMAKESGAAELPEAVKTAMKFTAKGMKLIAARI